ncbi:hypothetical protein HPB49_006282 [Dermacentor silvarum]|uniref:Uncharacterized protein n=1 Tax=Dermacentor silvarum TaxID=543639 RepID=A0ACB8DVV2_DERSI|nr:hypothetical protein HPB49_006282 [Dermacentor silvarum]
MYALVRFLDHDHAHDTRRYVVRVDDIRDFHPEHETDFDGKAVYFVHWEDNVDSDNTGDYRAQILRLGATEKETREAPKRIPIPKMIIDEDFDDEESVPKKATFHLQRGICLTSIQAKRIFSHKKPTLVVKETAQAIWSQKGLASRSVKGGIAPRKKSLGEPAKPALTPEKVNIVEATLSHWARVNDLDSSAIAANLTNILSEKIQDCIKAERKRALNE